MSKAHNQTVYAYNIYGFFNLTDIHQVTVSKHKSTTTNENSEYNCKKQQSSKKLLANMWWQQIVKKYV